MSCRDISLFAILLLGIAVSSIHAKRSYYTAAVFEHTGSEPSNDSLAVKVKKNLGFYQRAANIAYAKGTDIIVFPEYGILPYANRSLMRPLLENIPDPKKVKTTPCSRPDLYAKKPILYTLSCIAKNYSMYVVANVGDIQNCTGDPDCRDGAYHFNTNVVFDRNGTILLRYHKEYLFMEYEMDVPKENQIPIFNTEFGTFGTFVCFDILFEKITKIAQLTSVVGIAFSTNWVNIQPQLVSIEYFQAFAMANNITFLAADRQVPKWASVGSGIFEGKKGALVYTYNPDGISKLVVAKVGKFPDYIAPVPYGDITAITANASRDWTDDGKNVPEVCPKEKGYLCMKEATLRNYTFVKLNGSYGSAEACNNGLCCKLSYTSYGLRENYYFGAFKGLSNVAEKYYWCEEVCILVRCEDENGVRCSKFPWKSTTKFHSVSVRGNFTSDFVYPTVIANDARLVPTKYWHQNDDKSIVTYNYAGISYITAGLKGRCYKNDPPYNH